MVKCDHCKSYCECDQYHISKWGCYSVCCDCAPKVVSMLKFPPLPFPILVKDKRTGKLTIFNNYNNFIEDEWIEDHYKFGVDDHDKIKWMDNKAMMWIYLHHRPSVYEAGPAFIAFQRNRLQNKKIDLEQREKLLNNMETKT